MVASPNENRLFIKMLIVQLTLPDIASSVVVSRVNEVVEKIELYMNRNEKDEKYLCRLCDRVRGLHEALKTRDRPRILVVVNQLDAVVQKILLKGDIVSSSFVFFERPLVHGADSEGSDNWDHVRCVLESSRDEMFLRPKKHLVKSNLKVDVTGCPSQKKTRGEYLLAVDEYPEQKEQVDWVVDDLLNSPALNIPGDIKIQDTYIRSQVEADIYRLSSIRVDDAEVHTLHGLSGRNVKAKAFCVFERLLKALGSDVELTEQLTKLITQASLARPYFLLWKKTIKLDFLFNLNTLDNHFYIYTKPTQGKGGTVVVKEVSRFAIVDYSAMEDTKEKSMIRYLKFVRIMELNKESLRRGRGKGSKVTDYYSKYYRSREEMELFDVDI